MKLLEVQNVTVRYGNLTVLDGVNCTLCENEWHMVIGPNGAGKSTLVNAIAQTAPYTGRIAYLGQDVRRWRPHEIAQRMGVLSQAHFVGYSFTVGEVVRMGRYAYTQNAFSKKCGDDEEKVRRALRLTGMEALEQQSVLTLSGGELQRTFLAQVLAQDPKILILDEPTNHLDLVYQKQIFALIATWLKGEGRAAISVVHDLSLAKVYGTHALLLDHGKTVAQGETAQVFDPTYLNAAYGMDVGAWMREMGAQWQT